jgi:hypothetical protein
MKFRTALKTDQNSFSPKVSLKCSAGEMFTAAKQLLATAGKNSNATQHLSKLELQKNKS